MEGHLMAHAIEYTIVTNDVPPARPESFALGTNTRFHVDSKPNGANCSPVGLFILGIGTYDLGKATQTVEIRVVNGQVFFQKPSGPDGAPIFETSEHIIFPKGRNIRCRTKEVSICLVLRG